MAFFTLKKRCQYCGSVLDKDGNCPNADCIAHKNVEPQPAEKDDEK